MSTTQEAHEHFCSVCYGRKTNGQASGWYRCVKQSCTLPQSVLCRKHVELLAAQEG